MASIDLPNVFRKTHADNGHQLTGRETFCSLSQSVDVPMIPGAWASSDTQIPQHRLQVLEVFLFSNAAQPHIASVADVWPKNHMIGYPNMGLL
jgi:hypothetical protein